MSLSQIIKDYIDAINNFCDSFYGDINIISILQFTLFYLGQSFKFLIQYIISFQWWWDFCSLKVTIPSLINSYFIETYSLGNPMSYFSSFFETPDLMRFPFFSGLVNSILISLPFSASHILWIRILSTSGLYAGFFAGLGIVVGQALLIICVLFGLRFILFPWLSFEILHYFLGIFLLWFAFSQIGMRSRPSGSLMRIEPKYFGAKLMFRNIFLFHFALTWTEQNIFFQYLSNISFTPEPTLFEVLNRQIPMSKFEHLEYILGLVLGNIFWTLLLGALIFWGGYALANKFHFGYTKWVLNVNKVCISLLVAFAFISLPYYNFDFVLTSPLGFIPRDDALPGFNLKSDNRDFKRGRLGVYSLRNSLDTDIAPFDRGRYTAGKEVELSFEDLNYEGEYAWRARWDRVSHWSRGKVIRFLKKYKSRYKKWAVETELYKERLAKWEPKIKIQHDPYQDDLSEGQLYRSIFPFFLNKIDLVQRFVDDYQQDESAFAYAPIALTPDDQEDDVNISAFSDLMIYALEMYAGAEQIESDDFEAGLGKRMKFKYYTNYVYKAILSVDFYDFLSRQPKKYLLKSQEENELFRKRLILANYYDNLRDYKKMPYYSTFRNLFNGPKSYANRVYNQQFKGTLKVLKRLFAISLSNPTTLEKESVLKFDQPLYKEKQNEQNPILHEELKNSFSFSIPEKQAPFLRETNPIPFYAGWDEQSRKFLITNYLLPHGDSSLETHYFHKVESQTKEESKILHFLTWPLSESKIKELKHSPTQPFKLMFTSFDDPANINQRDVFEYPDPEELALVYETLPCIVKRVDVLEPLKIRVKLQPLRGGWLWPGSEPLRSEVKKVISDFKSDVKTKLGNLNPLKRGWRDSNP